MKRAISAAGMQTVAESAQNTSSEHSRIFGDSPLKASIRELVHILRATPEYRKRPFVIAVQGPCASGKTRLAAKLAQYLFEAEWEAAIDRAHPFFQPNATEQELEYWMKEWNIRRMGAPMVAGMRVSDRLALCLDPQSRCVFSGGAPFKNQFVRGQDSYFKWSLGKPFAQAQESDDCGELGNASESLKWVWAQFTQDIKSDVERVWRDRAHSQQPDLRPPVVLAEGFRLLQDGKFDNRRVLGLVDFMVVLHSWSSVSLQRWPQKKEAFTLDQKYYAQDVEPVIPADIYPHVFSEAQTASRLVDEPLPEGVSDQWHALRVDDVVEYQIMNPFVREEVCYDSEGEACQLRRGSGRDVQVGVFNTWQAEAEERLDQIIHSILTEVVKKVERA